MLEYPGVRTVIESFVISRHPKATPCYVEVLLAIISPARKKKKFFALLAILASGLAQVDISRRVTCDSSVKCVRSGAGISQLHHSQRLHRGLTQGSVSYLRHDGSLRPRSMQLTKSHGQQMSAPDARDYSVHRN